MTAAELRETDNDDRDERGSWGLLKEQEQEQEEEIYEDQTIEMREIHIVTRLTIEQDSQEYIIKCDL